MNNTIVFSIVDYKSANKTIKYIKHLESIFRDSKISFVVVDNSCDSKNLERLCCFGGTKHLSQYEKYSVFVGKTEASNSILVVDSLSNSGYAKGNNLAYHIAVSVLGDFEYFIVTNNDLRIENNLVTEEELSAMFAEDNVGVVGPQIVDLSGKCQSPCQKESIYKRWFFPMLIYPFKTNTSSGEKENNTCRRKAYYINGSFMIFRSKVFDEVGGFDEGTFLFAEEPIMAERLKNNHYDTVFDPRIRIVHEHSATIKDAYSILNIIKMRYHSDRYYYINYIHTNKFSITVSDIAVKCFEIKYRFVHFIMKTLKRKNV